MKKLLLVMILITFDIHAICIITSDVEDSKSVEIDGRYYKWTSLSLGQKDSCRKDRITRKNKEIKKEQQEIIQQEKPDVHSTCIISTNLDGSKAAVIDDVYQDWSRLTDNEKAFCVKNKTARVKGIEKKQKKKIKQEKSDEHYTCIMFTLDNNYWVAEIGGKYYEFSSLTDYEKASCQKDKIAREKEIKNEHLSNNTYQSNIDEMKQEKRGSIILWIITIIVGFLIYQSL